MTQIQLLFDRFVDYSDAFKGNTPRSLGWLNGTFNRFVTLSNIHSLLDFNRSTIEQCIYIGRREHNWSPKTIRNFLQVLSLFADWLVMNDYINENPTSKLPRPKIPKALPKALTKEQADEILGWTMSLPYTSIFDKTKFEAIISTFIFAGIRYSELENLTIGDINLVNGTLFVRRGKGLKDRFIPINERLNSVLTRYFNERRNKGKECPYFFTGTLSDNKICKKQVDRLIKKIRDKSGIYFSAHTLRHTFATLMLQSGCDIYTLSKLLGHSDIKTTTIYLLISDSDLNKSIGNHPLNFKGCQSFENSLLNS